MITTKTERLRRGYPLSSVSYSVDRTATLSNNELMRKAKGGVGHKEFPIAVKLGHLRTATDKIRIASTQNDT